MSWRIQKQDLERIPKSGPVLAVANHPFGLLEGVLLTTILPKIRGDFKIVTNSFLAGIPELERFCLFVDPFQSRENLAMNSRALRGAIRWLQSGGLVVIFPAGTVSHWSLRSRHITDPAWNQTAAVLLRKTRAPALPIFFAGGNSLSFQMLGIVHPGLRTSALPREFLKKECGQIEVLIGRLAPYGQLAALGDDAAVTRYLRWRTYLLANRCEAKPCVARGSLIRRKLAARQPADALAREINALGTEAELDRAGEYSVLLAQAPQIPSVLKEIGRLRELTFRGVGEGSGRKEDLDRFDHFYEHLFLWNHVRREIAGAYRLACTEQILGRFGVNGLYTASLFRYDPRFFSEIGPAVELGRSFVAPEYQKHYAPLLMLWRGIGSYIARRPMHVVLFGAVSISNAYSPAARRLMAEYLEAQHISRRFAGLVRPRRPFRPPPVREWDRAAIRLWTHDFEELSRSISEIEADGKGVPVLLRQYLKLGGEMLAFNLDRKFSDALDGLVLVDLRRTDPALLARFMGPEAAGAFGRQHGGASCQTLKAAAEPLAG